MSNKTKYFAEVSEQGGTNANLENNLNFKKMTPSGATLGCLFSSLELRGYFESLQSGISQKDGLPYPLLTYPFLDFIENHDFSDYELIEFGSGQSTQFFENIFKVVKSYETDKQWFEFIRAKLKKTTYILIGAEQLENGNFEIDKINPSKTLVLVDAACNRYKLTLNILNKINPAFIVLDNSEWYQNTVELLNKNDYFEIPFWGIKNSEHWESCTSLFISLNKGNKLIKKQDRLPSLSRKKMNTWDSIN